MCGTSGTAPPCECRAGGWSGQVGGTFSPDNCLLYSSPSLRYYACLCGHEELVLYLLANGERRGRGCVRVCAVCACAGAQRHGCALAGALTPCPSFTPPHTQSASTLGSTFRTCFPVCPLPHLHCHRPAGLQHLSLATEPASSGHPPPLLPHLQSVLHIAAWSISQQV